MSLPGETVTQISDALYGGRKIEAIKLYRAATGAQLKTAKEFIDALESRLRQESPDKFTVPPSGAGCSSSAATLVMLAIYFVTRSLFG